MKITVTDVKHVALLSRLEMSEKEIEEYSGNLNVVLEYMGIMNSLDTGQTEPTIHVLPLKNVFREDELKPSLAKQLVLQNAPEEEEGCFKVPRIL